jgi:hypothetical protein
MFFTSSSDLLSLMTRNLFELRPNQLQDAGEYLDLFRYHQDTGAEGAEMNMIFVGMYGMNM